jgi:protein ImuB
VNRRRILSLRLPWLPIDRLRRLTASCAAPAEAAPAAARPAPWVVVAKEANALRLSACDAAARAMGLAAGMPLANARAICPDLQVFDADPEADLRTLAAVADWCDRYTPLVALDAPHGLLLDITGCAHLFGGEAALLQDLCTALRRQGFAASGAVAATPACARAMAMAAPGQVVPTGREVRAVQPLPVAALGADPVTVRGLQRAGLKRIGEVAARERHELAARFGSGFTALLAEVLGERDAPISPRRPPPDFLVEKRFPEPVATEEVIAATLARLGAMLATAMQRQGKGARHLAASFFRTDGVVRLIAVQAGRPVTQPEVMMRLFRERLDALADPLDPGFGFDLIRLAALQVETVTAEQRGFDSRAADDDEVAALVDRLAARMGSSRISVHLPRDSHIPERAEAPVPAQTLLATAQKAEWPVPVPGEPPRRPLRLFARPEPIAVVAEVPDGAPARFEWRRARHEVIRAEGPERLAPEWWRDAGAATRDYFRVEDSEGLRFWIFRDGLYGGEGERAEGEGAATPPRWYVHGLFA